MTSIPRRGAARTASQPTVLIIDDDPDLRGSLAEALREAGYAVATAHDGASALVLLHSFSADLILVDLGMPGMTGLEFLAKWSAEPRNGAAVVLMSGAESMELPASGWVAKLPKPFSLDQLLETVQRFVRA
jgi:two-component system, chemotaxis family, chemotaxis protein CheY